MPSSIFTLSAAEKERKIAKVAHLIPKYYDDGSIVNEPGIVAKISKLLKPNLWLRVEDDRYGKYDYSKPIQYGQYTSFMKPIGIWASKGEWVFSRHKDLTLIEVDYSRILVLTEKEDYIEFEDKYCKKKPKKRIHYTRRTDRKSLIKGGAITSRTKKLTSKTKKQSKNKDETICIMSINWDKVSRDYDGIAMVPWARPYFDFEELLKYNTHLWISTYDVSSLVIWNHDGQKPITKMVSLGNAGKLYSSKDELDEKKVIKVLKAGMKKLEV